MLRGTENNLRALLGDFDSPQRPTLSGEIEFIIVFNSGRLFYTGGQEDADQLLKVIAEGKTIFGSYCREQGPWQPIRITGAIEAILDIREDTEGNEPSN